MSYSLAIDIGASSGRHILGKYENGKIVTEEIYRFDNNIINNGDCLSWDVSYLLHSVIEGIKKCGEIGKIPATVAIDTWGVDYVLLDKDGVELLPAFSYRDERTNGIPQEIDKMIPREELYKKTGEQIQNYNTIYQLYCDKKTGKLSQAKHLLMMPEYLSYKLSGVIKSEYTISSTTGLLNSKTRDWDDDVITKLGFDRSIFNEVCMPGTVIGNLKEDIRSYVGFDTTVVFAPAHDTASAMAVCSEDINSLYISSGTWSLVGIINKEPVLTKESFDLNFANEGGVNGTYRFLKNIMGMWLFQNIRKNLDKKYTYDEMMYMAMQSDYKKTFDPNDPRLISPPNMIDAIKECLDEAQLMLEDVLSSVYHSLAASYCKVCDEVESLTKKKISQILIVGGGSKDKYLNKLTEMYTKKTVLAGPSEATALGNLKTQLDIAQTF